MAVQNGFDDITSVFSRFDESAGAVMGADQEDAAVHTHELLQCLNVFILRGSWIMAQQEKKGEAGFSSRMTGHLNLSSSGYVAFLVVLCA